MANATAITVNTLSTAGATFTKDVLDTGTAPVTISAAVGGETDRVFLLIENQITNTLTVSIVAGDNPPAFRAGIGALSKTGIATTPVLWGPFESGRHIQDDGSLTVTFTPSTAATVNTKFSLLKMSKI